MQRKTQSTVVFIDIVASTAIVSDLEPDVAQGLLSRALDFQTDIIEEFGGIVNQHMGDGLMAFFGEPGEHNEHAARAIISSQKILKKFQEFGREIQKTYNQFMQIRIGINSGEVAVKKIKNTGYSARFLVTGKTTNIAKKIEAAAGPGQILISETTKALAERYFLFKDNEPIGIKGMNETVRTYKVVSLLEVDQPRIVLPKHKVQSCSALNLLSDYLFCSKELRQKFLYLFGSAGSGKTTIVSKAIYDQIQSDKSIIYLKYQCSPNAIRNLENPLDTIFIQLASAFLGGLGHTEKKAAII